MDKGKRPMTAVHALAKERAKKAAYRSTGAALRSISQSQGPDPEPVYQGIAPMSLRPPFPVEPTNVANIVGTQVPAGHVDILRTVAGEMERSLLPRIMEQPTARYTGTVTSGIAPTRAALAQRTRRDRERAQSQPVPPFISKAALAQRARRDREKKASETSGLPPAQMPSTFSVTPAMMSTSTHVSPPTNITTTPTLPQLVSQPSPFTISSPLLNPIQGSLARTAQPALFLSGATFRRQARIEREASETHISHDNQLTHAHGLASPTVGSVMLPASKRSVSQRARRARERSERAPPQPRNRETRPLLSPLSRTIITPQRQPQNGDQITSILSTSDVCAPINSQAYEMPTSDVASSSNCSPSSSHMHPTNPSYETQGYGEEGYHEEYNMWEQNRGAEQPSTVRHDLGGMDVECPFCKALHWMDERLTNSSMSNPRFGTCCLQGKIRLPPFPSLPAELQELYDGNDARSISFRNHSRDYNNAFAFTSIGVSLDERVFSGCGPRPFIIHGELKHRTGALLPNEGEDARFSQIYIYDPAEALAIRQRHNPTLRADVFDLIQRVITRYNRFAVKFRHAYELLREAEEANHANINVHATLHYSSKKDKRRYNLPTADEVAVIIPGDGFVEKGSRDVRLHLRGGQGFMQVNECHPAYLPLHYVLFFPCGDLGWAPELRQWDASRGMCSDERLTQLDFYSYLLFKRRNEYNPILRMKKLTQQFIVDAWAATEQNKLRWVLNKQDKIRVELYDGIIDIADECVSADQIGRRVILPSSHHGSPRHMFEIYQDSMAITRYNRHPDIFLTMTANPKWPEVLAQLDPGEDSTDHPEVIAKVFNLKRKALMREVKFRRIFGCVVAHVYTIEFQKRGLPHMHVLFYLKDCDKIKLAEQIDQMISAEFPDREKEPELYETVLRCMVHGPCGKERNPRAPCMMDGDCSKYFPRQWCDKTTINEDGYPTYMRRDDGVEHWVNNIKVDNRDVVPYNPYLCQKFLV